MANVGFESAAAAERVVQRLEELRNPGGVRPQPAAHQAYPLARVVALQPEYLAGHSLGALIWYDPKAKADQFRPGFVLVRFADGTAPPAGTRDLGTLSGAAEAKGQVFGVYTIERGSLYGYYPGDGGPPDGDLVTVAWTGVESVSMSGCCVVYNPVKYRLTGRDLLLTQTPLAGVGGGCLPTKDVEVLTGVSAVFDAATCKIVITTTTGTVPVPDCGGG